MQFTVFVDFALRYISVLSVPLFHVCAIYIALLHSLCYSCRLWWVVSLYSSIKVCSDHWSFPDYCHFWVFGEYFCINSVLWIILKVKQIFLLAHLIIYYILSQLIENLKVIKIILITNLKVIILYLFKFLNSIRIFNDKAFFFPTA